ncbi:MAG: hypothetical protein EON54_11680 [Alcaligenaceae bacterium]|nr:MAG: hypothetical protein EON54_11680 [Alcaligenaceae bacterium]
MKSTLYLVHIILILIVRAKMPAALGEIGQYGKLAADIGMLLVISHYWHRWIEAPSAAFGVRLAKRFAAPASVRVTA